MNLFDVLFMQKTGKIKPNAELFDILFAKKLQSAMEKLVTILGNPLTFTTKKAQLAKSTKISMEPIQEGSGDPSPENVRPISGRTGVTISGCGKNLFDITAYPLTQGRYINGNYGSTGTSENNACTLNFIPCVHLRGKTITLNKRPSGTNPGFAFYSSNDASSFISGYKNDSGTIGTKWTIDVPDDASFMRFTCKSNETDIQLELGSESTSYKPYTESNEITISFGQTVYGGTLDVEKGELVVDRKLVTIGDYSWTYVSQYKVFRRDFVDAMSNTIDVMSSVLKTTDVSISNMDEYSIRKNTEKRIYIKVSSDITTHQELVDEIGNEAICYELEEPTTIQLTPEQVSLLKGVNNIWTDGDSIELTYKA